MIPPRIARFNGPVMSTMYNGTSVIHARTETPGHGKLRLSRSAEDNERGIQSMDD